MSMKKIINACLFTLCLTAPLAQAEVFELRTYTTHPGRLGDLLQVFEDHLLPHFEKHGMRNIAYWVPTGELGENTLIYIVAHDSEEAGEASWQGFREDPATAPMFEEAFSAGPPVDNIVSVYMETLPWSPAI